MQVCNFDPYSHAFYSQILWNKKRMEPDGQKWRDTSLPSLSPKITSGPWWRAKYRSFYEITNRSFGIKQIGDIGGGVSKEPQRHSSKDLRFLCSTIHGQKITRPSNMQQPSNIYQQPSKNSWFFPVRTSKPKSFGGAQLRHFFCYSSMCVAGLVASFNGSFIAKKLCPPTTNPNSNDNNDI